MDIFKKIFFLLFISLLVLTGCKKDDSDSDSSVESEMKLELGDIMCKVDGIQTKFSFGGSSEMIKSNVNHYDADYYPSPTGKVIQLGRSNTDFKIFVIDIFKDFDKIKTPETFTSKPSDFEDFSEDDELYSDSKEIMLSYTDMSSMKMYTSWGEKGSSSVTITSKLSDVIEGTFNGVLYAESVDIMNFDFSSDDIPEISIDSVLITDGKFKIQLVRESLFDALE